MQIQTVTLCTTAGYVNAQSRDQIFIYLSCILGCQQWRTEGGGLGVFKPPPRNSKVLTKLHLIAN